MNSYNILKKETEQYEKRVEAQKTTEGLYTVTSSRLGVLDQLISNSNNFTSIITEVSAMNKTGLNLSAADVDEKGNLTVTLIASSSSTLDDFVSYLNAKEEKKLFTDIVASGIIREKKGVYHLGLTLKANKSLIQ